ncbi:MAG: hypothetical protein Aurels2KO_16830 [Aureliella sp.]
MTKDAWFNKAALQRGDGRSELPDGATSEHSAVIAELHAELFDAMHRIAWAILRDWQLADDAVQEAFFLLSQRIDQLCETHEKSQFAPWLVKTVQYQALNLRRRQKREKKRLDEVFEFSAEHTAEPSGKDLGQKETTDAIAQAIQRLPREQRDVVLRRMYQGQTFADIAQELDTSIGTITSRMRLALKKLQVALKHHEDT